MKIPTVKIEHDSGYCWINEEDFDPVKHKVFDDQKELNSGQSTTATPTVSDDKTNGHPQAPPLQGEERVTLSTLVNLNTASERDLVALPSVGSSRAKLIIKKRDYTSIKEAKVKLPDLNWTTLESLVEV